MARIVHFRKIDESMVPSVTPLTKEEQDRLGTMMQIPKAQRKTLQRTVVLVLPQIEICMHYMEWFINQGSSDQPEPYGITIMNKEQWITEYGQEAMTQLVKSFRKEGRPTMHWLFAHARTGR
jgi:hypothetical protein